MLPYFTEIMALILSGFMNRGWNLSVASSVIVAELYRARRNTHFHLKRLFLSPCEEAAIQGHVELLRKKVAPPIDFLLFLFFSLHGVLYFLPPHKSHCAQSQIQEQIQIQLCCFFVFFGHLSLLLASLTEIKFSYSVLQNLFDGLWCTARCR